MKLTAGVGSPETGGCWMVAIHMYSQGVWNDQPLCVPETIRQLGIVLNDVLPDGLREELIGPVLFHPMGRDRSAKAELKRARLIARYVVDDFFTSPRDVQYAPSGLLRIMAWLDDWRRGEWEIHSFLRRLSSCDLNAMDHAMRFTVFLVHDLLCIEHRVPGVFSGRNVSINTLSHAAAVAIKESITSQAVRRTPRSDLKLMRDQGEKLLNLILELCEIGENPPQEIDPVKRDKVLKEVCRV